MYYRHSTCACGKPIFKHTAGEAPPVATCLCPQAWDCPAIEEFGPVSSMELTPTLPYAPVFVQEAA